LILDDYRVLATIDFGNIEGLEYVLNRLGVDLSIAANEDTAICGALS
jgi:hypothetical protein